VVLSTIAKTLLAHGLLISCHGIKKAFEKRYILKNPLEVPGKISISFNEAQQMRI
jgi:hypothetical protein